MSKRYRGETAVLTAVGAGFLGYICFWIFVAVIFGYWTADEWSWAMDHILHSAYQMPWYIGVLINIVLNAIAIPADFLIWIIRLFIG